MSTRSRLDEIFRSAPVLPFDDGSKLVIMSDCHRGDGSWIDNFAHNQNIFYAALRHYFDNGFTYIENGDGDELWKFRCLADIDARASRHRGKNRWRTGGSRRPRTL